MLHPRAVKSSCCLTNIWQAQCSEDGICDSVQQHVTCIHTMQENHQVHCVTRC
jgi:hypothetical protein